MATSHFAPSQRNAYGSKPSCEPATQTSVEEDASAAVGAPLTSAGSATVFHVVPVQCNATGPSLCEIRCAPNAHASVLPGATTEVSASYWE